MHIIFGKDNAVELENKYTILELDLIMIGQDGPVVPAYCIIENMSILDLPKVESMKQLHENLIANYRSKEWKYCQDALEHLQGFWGGEVDSFYADISARIESNIKNPPSKDWTPVIYKV
jgi:hypothetical protein